MASESAEHIRSCLLDLASTARSTAADKPRCSALASEGYVSAKRAEIASALEAFERAGQSRISRVCREIIETHDCTFSHISQWGVCAVSGRTVNSLVRVNTGTRELDVDSKFGPFVMSLWNFSHMSLIEETRLQECGQEDDEDCAAAEFYSTKGEKDIAFAYSESLHEVLRVIDATMQTLGIPRGESVGRDWRSSE